MSPHGPSPRRPVDVPSELRRLRLTATAAAIAAVLLVAYHLASAAFGSGSDGGGSDAARHEAPTPQERLHVTFDFKNGTLWSQL